MHLGVGLTVGPEVADALERRTDVGVVHPDRLDPHADVDVGDLDLLQQVHDRQVAAVEQDQRARVGHLHPLPVELHVHDAERGDGALVRELDGDGRGDAVGWARATGRHVDLPADGAALAEDLLAGDPLQEAGGRTARGVQVAQLRGRADAAHLLHVAQALGKRDLCHQADPSGTKHSMSLMWPSRSARQRGVTRMPVLIASTLPASTACSIGESAPSGWISAHANGWSSGCFGIGSRTHAHVVTTPPGPTSTMSVSGSEVSGSYSIGGTSTRPAFVLE